MQSLADFADLSYGSAIDMQIKMDDGTDENLFKITSKNNLVLQQVEVSSIRGTFFYLQSRKISLLEKSTNIFVFHHSLDSFLSML